MGTPMIDQIIEDVQKSHIILNAKSGHGKSCALKTIIAELKKKYPRTIIKVFDVSQSWYHIAPLEWRQRISIETMRRITEQGKIDFRNLDDCVYEMGDLTEELRRFFVAIIIKQDYEVRREMGYRFGKESVENLPKTIYFFEDYDTYFDSTSLNKKYEASALLRDFIKVGRNFGLRAFCVVTATVGELGTKLRRRSTHLIGRIISDQDLRFYNRKEKGLGSRALEVPRFKWIYYNGHASVTFPIGDKVRSVPKDYVREQRTNIKESEQPLTKSEMSTLSKIVLAIIATFILTVVFLRL